MVILIPRDRIENDLNRIEEYRDRDRVVRLEIIQNKVTSVLEMRDHCQFFVHKYI